jgi:hypothetical protein
VKNHIHFSCSILFCHHHGNCLSVNDFKRQLNVNPNYQHPLIGMQLMWLIWMILLCGFKLVNNV